MTSTVFKGLRAVNKGIIIGIEVLVVVAVLFVGFVSYGLFRLSQGPVDLAGWQSDIENVLNAENGDVHFKIGGATLTWVDLKGPLTLNISELSVERAGQGVAEIHDVSIALAKAPLLIGLIRPERLMLTGPTLTLERSAMGEMNFGLSGPTSGRVPNLTRFLRDLARGTDKDGEYGLFSRIRGVEVRNARLRIADAQAGMTWQLNNVTLSFERVDVGLYGSMSVQLPMGQHFSAVMTYQRDHDVLTLSSQFKDFSLAAIAGRLTGLEWLRHQRLAVTGNFSFEFAMQDFILRKLQLQAQAEEGVLDTRGLLDRDIPVKDVVVDLAFDRMARLWDLRKFSLQAREVPMAVQGQLTAPPDGDYAGALDLSIPSLDHAQLDGFWPEAARGIPLERWLLQKITMARFESIKIKAPIRAALKGRQLTVLALRPSAAFAFNDLRVDYRPPLYALERGAGTGRLTDDTLFINLAAGQLKDLKLRETTLKIEDLIKPGAGQAYLDVKFTGPLKTALGYVALEPINKGDKIPVQIADVLGTGDFHALIDFPTIKDLPADRVNVVVDGTLKDMSLPKLVKGQTLSGGPFTMTIKDHVFFFKGKGQLEGRAITLDMAQPITRDSNSPGMELRARIDTDNRMRAAFGADLDGVEGAMPIDLIYREGARNSNQLDIAADLTPVYLDITSMKYTKAAGVAGLAKMKLMMKKDVSFSAQDVTITAPRLTIRNGSLACTTDGNAIKLKSADLPVFRLGAGDGALTLRRDANRMTITIKGKSLDLEPFLSGGGATDNAALQFNADVDALSFGGADVMQNANLSVAMNDLADLERVQLTAISGGKSATISYLPNANGKMTLNIAAENAGAFLRAMDIYDNMIGGSLSLTGQPSGTNNRDVKGRLVIKNFDVIKAPVLAQLINALSLEGIGDQLNNKGIGFKRLESGFAWQRRAGQDVMSFDDGSTSGASLGLTFDGIYDRRKKNIDISGTIIPLSGLNTFIGKIPLIGDILTGRSGGALVAATYHITGPNSKPQTMINPLSVLTPGILRRIFFEGTPHNPINDKAAVTPTNN